ncbi:MAG: integrase domain-containing protein [Burkholderiaceae bacterium]|nr:integrase domain-containing protein [Burkholderiaceae bacterium]
MGKESNWKSQLAEIIGQHNEMHAYRNKVISHRTRDARSQALFRMFRQLRDLGYQVAPANIGERHVAALMQCWTNQQSLTAQARQQPFSAAYIQQQLSILRVFAGWIGKPGLVQAGAAYVAEPALVTRLSAAQRDHTWDGQGIAAEELVRRVEALDRNVGLQLRLMMAFGMRRKEAVMFRPHVAEVPAYALPDGHPSAQRFVSFLRIVRGTKGGRLRYTAVRNDIQRQALDEARQVARQRFHHVGRPELTLKQSLDLFSNVVRTAGISRAGLGVTAHGLRHEFAVDLYFEITHVRAPVRGGDPTVDPVVRLDAYRQVAEQLGHHRPAISRAYLGTAGRTGGGDHDA